MMATAIATSGVQDQLDVCSQMYCLPWYPRPETLMPFFELALDFKRHVPPCVRHILRLAYQFNVQQMPSEHALNFFPSVHYPEKDINRFEDTGMPPYQPSSWWFNTIVLYSWLAPLHAMIRKESRNIRKLSVRQRRTRLWLDAQ